MQKRALAALVAGAAIVAANACGSSRLSAARDATPTTLDRATQTLESGQLSEFVRAVRSRLGDDFVGTPGARNRVGAVTRIEVILVDRDAARRTVDETRRLDAEVIRDWATTVAPIPVRVKIARRAGRNELSTG